MKFWIGTILKIALVGLCAAVGWKTCRYLLEPQRRWLPQSGTKYRQKRSPIFQRTSTGRVRRSNRRPRALTPFSHAGQPPHYSFLLECRPTSKKRGRGMHDQEQAQIAYLS